MHRTTIPLGVLAALAVAAPSAAAAPRWSSPATVFAPSESVGIGFGALTAAPDGPVYAAGSDGSAPVLSTNATAGTWSSPARIAPAEGAVTSVAADAAADGAVAVVWTVTGGSGSAGQTKVAVRGPGASGFGEPVSLGGPQGYRPTVALDAAGVATVAWRERPTSTSYVAKVADVTSAGAVGPAVELDAASAALDAATVTKGADGTTAVSWRRSGSGGYRSRVAVRPAGGSFGAAELLDAAPAGSMSPAEVAIDPSGGLTAVWGDQSGAFAARRPVGGSFSAKRPLDPASPSRGFGLGLASVPGGGVTAFDAGDALRSVRLDAEGTPQPATTIAPSPASDPGAGGGERITTFDLDANAAGTAIAAFEEPTDDGIRAAAAAPGGPFAAVTPLGFGVGGSAAASADRLVVLWTAPDSSIVASTYSEDARTDLEPGNAARRPPTREQQEGPDAVAPRIRLTSTTRQGLRLRRDGTLRVGLRLDEAATVRVLAKVRARGRTLAGAKATKRVKAGTSAVVLRLDRRERRSLARALRARRAVTVDLSVRATDARGNASLRPATRRLRAA